MTENEKRRLRGLLMTPEEYADARFTLALAQLRAEQWHWRQIDHAKPRRW
jgi:hypothetical protein